jgi:RNA ligase
METLLEYERDGWIISKKHPTFNLYIWNYTNHAMFKKKWDEVTLKCRSLVTDAEGNVVARSFDKFFNWNDAPAQIILKERQGLPFEVCKKYDGSLILVFWYKDTLIVASRASFNGKHVDLAREIIDEVVQEQSVFDKNLTYVFELIHPRTQVVINYRGLRELVLLAVFDKHEERRGVVVNGFRNAETVDPDTIDNLKTRNVPDEEGYVLVYEDSTRIKVKFPTYMLLNRHKTDLTPAHIGELYAIGTLENVIGNIPDEFFDEFKAVWSVFVSIDAEIVGIFEEGKPYAAEPREFALKYKNHKYFKTLMKLFRGKPYKQDLVSYYPSFSGMI